MADHLLIKEACDRIPHWVCKLRVAYRDRHRPGEYGRIVRLSARTRAAILRGWLDVYERETGDEYPLTFVKF